MTLGPHMMVAVVKPHDVKRARRPSYDLADVVNAHRLSVEVRYHDLVDRDGNPCEEIVPPEHVFHVADGSRAFDAWKRALSEYEVWCQTEAEWCRTARPAFTQ